VGTLRARLAGVYVLLVDDDPEILEMFSAALSHYGAYVRAARTGQQALVALGIARPDVIVADYRMPGMNGAALLAQVRGTRLEGERPIPAILCTGISGLGAAARAAGFDHCITKPVDPQTLADEIARLTAC
jgi:two-component system CheB/CheR fusion protein